MTLHQVKVVLLLSLIASCKSQLSNRFVSISEPPTVVDSIISEQSTIEKMDNFIDLNFDGHLDMQLLNEDNSGTGGDYYDVFLFNQDSNSYVFSNKLSGNLIEVNSTKRTLTYYWKAGVSINHTQILYFDKNGILQYSEKITNEVKSIDNKEALITNYSKEAHSEVLESRTDTTDFEGY